MNKHTKYELAALFASTDTSYKQLIESFDSVDDIPLKIFETANKYFFVETDTGGYGEFWEDNRSRDFPYRYNVSYLKNYIGNSRLINVQVLNDEYAHEEHENREYSNMLYTIPHIIINEFSDHKFDPFFWEQLGKPFKGSLIKDFIRNNYRPYWSYIPVKKQSWLRTSLDEDDEEAEYRHSPFIRFDAKTFNEWALKNMDWLFDPWYDTSKLSEEKLYVRQAFQYNLYENNAIVVKVGSKLMVVVRFITKYGRWDAEPTFDEAFYY